MKTDVHARARDLISASAVEGIAPADSAWLEAHPATCPDCARYAESVAFVRQALHSVAFTVNPELVRATQARVRLRARELREREHRLVPVWISCAVALAIAALSTPYLWGAFAWAGEKTRMSPMTWQGFFAVLWFAPALLAAILFLMFKRTGPETPAD